MTRRTATLVLLAVVLAVALGPLVALARPEPVCTATPGEWSLAGQVPAGAVWAIDVSKHQRPADVPYPALAAAGLCAVIVRAGTGLTPDPTAADHLARARAAGIPRTGTYWVPRSWLDPDGQAAAYVRQLARLRPTMAPVADLEGDWPAKGTARLAEAFAAGPKPALTIRMP
jgi:GH25 family lysozyme M1 (1,4-beta-N-acetylmuramidase)